MALWGTSDSDESKPKNLTTAEKKECYATASGWVREAGSKLSGNGNTNADPEILVAISGLAVSLGAADITDIEFVTTTFSKAGGVTLTVDVRFNEEVDVTGTPQLTVVNDQRANHTLSYASGSGSNELRFQLTIAANDGATNAGDVLSIGANALALNSGTIKDTADGTTNSSLDMSGVAFSRSVLS